MYTAIIINHSPKVKELTAKIEKAALLAQQEEWEFLLQNNETENQKFNKK